MKYAWRIIYACNAHTCIAISVLIGNSAKDALVPHNDVIMLHFMIFVRGNWEKKSSLNDCFNSQSTFKLAFSGASILKTWNLSSYAKIIFSESLNQQS